MEAGDSRCIWDMTSGSIGHECRMLGGEAGKEARGQPLAVCRNRSQKKKPRIKQRSKTEKTPRG